ncbi:NUDIX hydrolase [Streptomyces sp. NPDC015125]|uniref:NUDIX hydrolase n=1 Tax=Streptomyces sp. NPDC015125 TaxID=3364938 RepID=UPI0036FD4BD1
MTPPVHAELINDLLTATDRRPPTPDRRPPAGTPPPSTSSVLVIPDRDGHVLLMHRAADDFTGGLWERWERWELPSGGADPGEVKLDALHREPSSARRQPLRPKKVKVANRPRLAMISPGKGTQQSLFMFVRWSFAQL